MKIFNLPLRSKGTMLIVKSLGGKKFFARSDKRSEASETLRETLREPLREPLRTLRLN